MRNQKRRGKNRPAKVYSFLLALCLIAGMGAQIRCQNCGITRTLENTAAYCKGWASAIRSMPDYGKAIVCAAAQAQKAADWIMGVRYEGKDAE